MFKETLLSDSKTAAVKELELKNEHGAVLRVLNYGARITSWCPAGSPENSIILGYQDINGYLEDEHFLGAVVGRTAGRVPNGEMKIENTSYTLNQNEGVNLLHGGTFGFSQVLWDYNYKETSQSLELHLTYLSEDGEMGYPGNLSARVTYALDKHSDAVTFSIRAVSDKDTWCSLANHAYFNLGEGENTHILDHELKAPAASVLELDNSLIPTGQLLSAPDTLFDITQSKPLRDMIGSTEEQIIFANQGVDHFFILDPAQSKKIELMDPGSGRRLKIETTEPGAVIYTSQKLESSLPLHDGEASPYRGICIETQRLPDAFASEGKSCLLKAGDIYSADTVYTLEKLS
ncbi:aldose epimerase family protein [Sinobaca sp. H24]|uniref:aldose epimerase family protein n=1 Tax=Sinobaca sp. H24 TaxID=2923376 RepID=UPI00207A80A6|nr:aldose epimerase family protein [Sinobaca sp. H24]